MMRAAAHPSRFIPIAILMFSTMRHLTSGLLSIGLLSASFLSSTAAVAADKKEGQIGTGKPTGKYLTRDELRFCLKQKDVVVSLNADAAKESDELGATQDALVKSGDELKAVLDSLDKSSADEVKAYNDRAAAREQAVDAYQARVSAFNERVVADKKVRDAYLAACQNRAYFDEDELAIKKGK
jgi:hypothetical protein